MKVERGYLSKISPQKGEKNQKKTPIKDALYVLTTPPSLLIAAAKSVGTSDRGFINEITQAERDNLEKKYKVTTRESGPFVLGISELAAAVVPSRLLESNPAGDQFVQESVAAINELGLLPRKKIRKARKVFKRLPQEHVKKGINGISYAPLKEINNTLKKRNEVLDPEINPEIIDIYRSFQQRFEDRSKDIEEIFDQETKTIEFTDRLSTNFFIDWVAANEAGHGAYELLTEEQKETWKTLSKRPITIYVKGTTSENQHTENFVEFYALYNLARPLFKVLATRDEDMKEQYQFFKSFMPKDTKKMPTMDALWYMFNNRQKIINKTKAERSNYAPLDEISKDLNWTYHPIPEEQALQVKILRALATRAMKATFGVVNQDALNMLVMESLTEGFVSKNLHLMHDSERMKSFLIRNGIWQEATADASEQNIDGHTVKEIIGKESDVTGAFGLGDLTDQVMDGKFYGFPIFLENRMLVITPHGISVVRYKKEIKAKITEALRIDTIAMHDSPLGDVQQDGIRARVNPSESDDLAREEFTEKYQIPLYDSSERAFSAQSLETIEQILENLPATDRENVSGLVRIVNKRNIDKRQRKMRRKNIVLIDDMLLAGTQEALASHLIKAVSRSVLGNNKEIYDQFLTVSRWESSNPHLPRRILYKFLDRDIKNSLLEYFVTEQDTSTFLTATNPLHLAHDFNTCYEWYLTDKESFQQLAQEDHVLQAKYNLMEAHFTSSK